MNQKTIQNLFLYAVLALYFMYGLSSIGMTGLLFSSAIGLIGFSFHLDFDFVAALIIISGILWKMVLGQRRDGFSDNVPSMAGQNLQEITGNIQKFQRKQEPQATLSSQFSEGFSDSGLNASSDGMGGDIANSGDNSQTVSTASTASKVPASVSAPTATNQLAASLPTPSTIVAATATAPPTNKKAGFQDTSNGLFKLGSLPPDAVGGAHIDVGTTLMNALDSLKPDQIKTMTDDTRKLMETQKGLMGMLSSMKPMLQDGKDIMSTFNDMFGKGGMQMPSS